MPRPWDNLQFPEYDPFDELDYQDEEEQFLNIEEYDIELDK